jgi:NAD(P)-dependent dehydrogenase (short-subunit alcohol dehydrogenase family)
MHTLPTLLGKHAVVFGAGGSIGAAVARNLRPKARRCFYRAG